MGFDEVSIRKIKQNMMQGLPIFLEGMNMYGDEFKTSGKVALTDSNKYAIYDSAVFMDFCHKMRDVKTPLYAKFVTDFNYNDKGGLVIFKVYDYKDNVLYYNSSKEKIEKLSYMQRAFEIENLQKKTRNTNIDCKKVQIMRKFIANPININGKHYILASVRNGGGQNVDATVVNDFGVLDVNITPSDLVVLGLNQDIFLPISEK